LEVTNSYLGLVKDEFGWIRKQTLTGAERFITPELKEKEDMIYKAENEIVKLEYNLFLEIKEKVKEKKFEFKFSKCKKNKKDKWYGETYDTRYDAYYDYTYDPYQRMEEYIDYDKALDEGAIDIDEDGVITWLD
jgi:hypothetical protein